MYYLQEVLKHENDTIEGKRLAISGYGNVAWGIAFYREQRAFHCRTPHPTNTEEGAA